MKVIEKYIFVFDPNKCVGCGACAVACMNENGYQSQDRWRNIHSTNPAHHPFLPLHYLSLACNHCDDAPCLKNCPAKAYCRDERTGAVIHTAEKCIGCKYCTWACPYDAPKYNAYKGIVEKCTFCNHRLTEGEKPACAHLCPTGALEFKLHAFSREEVCASSPVPVDVGSHFKQAELRREEGPEVDAELFKELESKPFQRSQQKITAASEWPLVIFSLIVSSLVAIEWLQLIDNENLIGKVFFLIAGGLSALFSTLHLGQKGRAWRSLLHVQHSWLSREILFFALFMGAVFMDWFIHPLPAVIPGLMGMGLLLSIDMLYAIAMWRWPLKIHSAQTVLIATSLFFLVKLMPIIFWAIVAVRLILLLIHQYRMPNQSLLLVSLRVGSLLMTAIGLFLGVDLVWLLTAFIVGEIIDRIGFYNQLKVPDVSEEIQLN
ncbi:MAG: 4Fe-4S binding protein [Marinilabiliaceae bacterium]|nr:4Fe-4S binding protein [Marinilabiliaceae bacterium]